MNPVLDWIYAYPTPNIRKLLLHYHILLTAYPEITPKMRYGTVFYYTHTWIAYLNPIRKLAAIEVVFLQGKILAQSFPALATNGRKMVAGITVTDTEDLVLTQTIINVFEAALALQKPPKIKPK